MLADRAKTPPRNTLTDPRPGDLYVDKDGDMWFCNAGELDHYFHTTPEGIRNDGETLGLLPATPEEIAKFRKDHGL
jgi:hypothetical protein